MASTGIKHEALVTGLKSSCKVSGLETCGYDSMVVSCPSSVAPSTSGIQCSTRRRENYMGRAASDGNRHPTKECGAQTQVPDAMSAMVGDFRAQHVSSQGVSVVTDDPTGIWRVDCFRRVSIASGRQSLSCQSRLTGATRSTGLSS